MHTQDNRKVNAIVHVVLPYINGGLFDVFEYYHCIKQHCNFDVFLLLIFVKQFKYNNINEKSIFDMFYDKYDILDNDLDNVKFVYNLNKIIRFKFNNILYLDNHSFPYTLGKIFSENNIFVIDPYIPSKTNYRKISHLPFVSIYSELLNYKEIFDE